MNPKLFFLLISLLLTSCSYINNLYTPVNNTINTPIIIPENKTAIINISIPEPPKLIILDRNETNIIILENSILFYSDNVSILIDSGSESEVLKTIDFLNSLGITKLDYAIATVPKDEYIGGLGYLSLRLKPILIYDNGLSSDLSSYKLYKQYSNSTRIIHTSYLNSLIKVIVPFESGLSSDLSDNSLIIKFLEPSVLYMSDCGFGCESKINEQADILILGKHGGCLATSTDFLVKVNPKIVIGNPCDELKNRLKILGIVVYNPLVNGKIKITKNGVVTEKWT